MRCEFLGENDCLSYFVSGLIYERKEIMAKTMLNIGYSYTKDALAAIKGERDNEHAVGGVDMFFQYRVHLHLMFYPVQTFLVTEVGMFWTTEVISVCANDHVWFCTIEQWKKKLADNPKFEAAEIFDPLMDHTINPDDQDAVVRHVRDQKQRLHNESPQLIPDLPKTIKQIKANNPGAKFEVVDGDETLPPSVVAAINKAINE